MTRRLFSMILSASLTVLAASALAEDDSYMRLARLSYLEGHVSYQQSSDVDWSAASINFPLEPGDRIYTGEDGRAEIQFDDGSVCRLAENTDFEILSLKDDLIQIRILVGLATLTAAGSVDFEIDTPAAAFNTLRKGIYRFDIVENGDSDAIVRKGGLEAVNNGFSQRIETGELLHVRGAGDANPSLSQYNERDLWDEWNDRRDADLSAYADQDHLPNNVYIGASDMDRHGHWETVDTYGTVWVPYSVDDSWTPYSVGSWCYRPFYGWTWISYETWGWLPYHYGRWYRSPGLGWCWIPGPAFSFNFWSPGLVVFYTGPGWVSWCPLGPGDYYQVNNYYFNRKVYGYQLTQLRTLSVRLPDDPFNRHVRGSFRTVEIEQFKNGNFNDKSAGAKWKSIDQPWKQGSLIKDRLDVPPSPVSVKTAPSRPAIQPGLNISKAVVVRSNPSIRAGSGEQFHPITNANIRAVPSREWQNRYKPAIIENRNGGTSANRQTIANPQRDGADQGNRTFPGSTMYQQDGRWMNTPRRADTRENNGTTGGPAIVTPRSENTPNIRQVAPRFNIERPAVQAPQSPAPSERPRNEPNQMNNRQEQRSTGNPQVVPNFVPRPPIIQSAPRTQGQNYGAPAPGANGGANAPADSPRSRPDDGGKNASGGDNSGNKARSR
jgi:hypothetical protein